MATPLKGVLETKRTSITRLKHGGIRAGAGGGEFA